MLCDQNRVRIFDQIPGPNSSLMIGIMLTEHYIDDINNMANHVMQSGDEYNDKNNQTLSSENFDEDCTPSRKRIRISNGANQAEEESISLRKFSQWVAANKNITVFEQDMLCPFYVENEIRLGGDMQNKSEEEEDIVENTEKDDVEEDLNNKVNDRSRDLVQLNCRDVEFLARLGFLQQSTGSMRSSTVSNSSSGVLYCLTHPGVSIALSLL